MDEDSPLIGRGREGQETSGRTIFAVVFS